MRPSGRSTTGIRTRKEGRTDASDPRPWRRRCATGRRRDPLDEDSLPFDLAPDVLRLHLEAAEDLADRLLPLAEDTEQDVLRLDDAARVKSLRENIQEGERENEKSSCE